MKKIIITASIRDLLENEHTFLKRASLKILTAHNNEGAFKIHGDEKADLIIADFSSGSMSGERLCSLIRDDEKLRAVSIIMLCSEPEIYPEELAKCKANAFITAPVSPSFLIDKAHRLLNIPQRETYRAPISIKVQGESQNKPFLCHAENISSSGMLFLTDREMEKGERIFCSFILPDSTHVRTDAQVVRVVKRLLEAEITECGIRFSNILEEHQEAIEEYVRKTREKI